METIEVGNEKVEIGSIICKISDTEAYATVSKAAIANWLSVVHEIVGRGVFADYIVWVVNDDGSRVRFAFKSTSDPEVMRAIIKVLLTQAARMHNERSRMRSRMNHPSSGVPDNLVVINPDRYHKKPQPRWRNTPKGVRGR